MISMLMLPLTFKQSTDNEVWLLWFGCSLS